MGYNAKMNEGGVKKDLPAAVLLAKSGELSDRVKQLLLRLEDCDICPHLCRVNRLKGDIGKCGIANLAQVAASCAHHGEEPVLSGKNGAGNVFLTGCNLRCCYCQNYQISSPGRDDFPSYNADALAAIFLELQAEGCHNISWVSPSHVVPQLLAALEVAISQGLLLPLVYNSNGFDSLSTLKLLDGVVDIYLPDYKYADHRVAARLSGADNYPDIALQAIVEMFRQVGPLIIDENGLAKRGLIVRHLVLPGGLSGSRRALKRLADEISPDITVSLMAQYYPASHARGMPELARTITVSEYEEALDAFADSGLENGWAQELSEAPDYYQPDFHQANPFER